MRRDKRHFAVIGLGRFGRQVARELAELGHYVLGYDIEPLMVTRVADSIEETVIADARDEVAMREAGLASFSNAIVAIGSNLEASTLAFMNLRSLGVEQVTVKASDNRHRRILEALGARDIIVPEREAATHLAERLHNPALQDYLNITPSYHLAIVEAKAATQGQTPWQIAANLAAGLELVGLVRQQQLFSSSQFADLQLEPGDRLLLAGTQVLIRDYVDH